MRRGTRNARGLVPLIVGSVLTGLTVLMALSAPIVAPYEIHERDDTLLLAGPSRAHPLGTDEDGADVLTELLYGARVAVAVGLLTVALSLAVGLVVGLVAGYAGGWADELLMRLTELLLSFPGILLAILIIFVTQEPSTLTVVFALSVTGWAGYARLVRGQVLLVKRQEFILAARCLGAGPVRIALGHILPNVMGPVIVQATFGVATAILAEASLSFLGLGPQGTPSWGAMLEQGAALFIKSPTLALAPGLAIVWTVMGVNLLGDALRDRLDPHAG
jgi:peptide/nickel transport system permease protein